MFGSWMRLAWINRVGERLTNVRFGVFAGRVDWSRFHSGGVFRSGRAA